MFCLPEKATYWQPQTNNGFGGNDWSPPVVVDARIAFVNEEVTNPEGHIVTTSHAVYTNDAVEMGWYLFPGVSTELNPTNQPGAKRVVKKAATPSGTVLKRFLI